MKHIAVLFGVLFLTCCSDPVQEKPVNMIEKGLFIEVLSELQIVESVYLKSTDKPSAKKQQLAENNKAVLAKFELSAAQFDSSMNYYKQNPAEMMAIYDSVIVTLEYKLSAMEDNKNKPN